MLAAGLLYGGGIVQAKAASPPKSPAQLGTTPPVLRAAAALDRHWATINRVARTGRLLGTP